MDAPSVTYQIDLPCKGLASTGGPGGGNEVVSPRYEATTAAARATPADVADDAPDVEAALLAALPLALLVLLLLLLLLLPHAATAMHTAAAVATAKHRRRL
jgi:hypothetical protein